VSFERHWQRLTPVSLLLYPASLVFRVVTAARRFLYSASVLKSGRLGAPVIVVGNITVGGTGKTPLVLWLASFLSQHGMRPGIVSRGYGGEAAHPRPVPAFADPAHFGDEPVLLAQRSRCPVWVGHDRLDAGRALLAAQPSCDVVLSDDGLQHYRLARDAELAVIDGARGLGNGLMLPAGPLREPASRLREVDAVVVNGPPHEIDHARRVVALRLEGRQFHNVLNPDHVVGPEYFQRQRVLAVAGIGNPARFFSHLNGLGMTFEARAFPDHHAYTADDLDDAGNDAVVMTEKDAVKCAAFARETHWALRVDAVPDPELGELVLRRLRTPIQ
jgi:tetraacyldisaccharide 4'-kinase